MNTPIRSRILVWSTLAVVACAGLALRDAVASRLGQRIDEAFFVESAGQHAIWAVAYYAMWAALTPFIFLLARRVRIRPRRWVWPLGFHVATSLVVSICAPIALEVVYGALVFNVPLPAPAACLTPVWADLVTYRAVADTSLYWLILAAGVVLDAYDRNQARRRRATDLERALVSAQADALRMQLQPHFLFNTLNAINVLAVEGDSDALVTTIGRLARLLRSSMDSNGRQLTTVADELAWLDQYLAIQETRFGDRLHIVRRIEPAARHALVPNLILQPIIENSIKHGFSRRIDASRVTIAIGREDDMLTVSVEDDGPGLPPGWDLATHCGRGLKNVVERLDRLYAGAWTFTLANAPGRGTIATLRLPWHDGSAPVPYALSSTS